MENSTLKEKYTKPITDTHLLASATILTPFHLGPVPSFLHPTVDHIHDWTYRKAVEGWGTSPLLSLPWHLTGSLPGQLADFQESGEISGLHPGPWELVFRKILGSVLISFSYKLIFSLVRRKQLFRVWFSDEAWQNFSSWSDLLSFCLQDQKQLHFLSLCTINVIPSLLSWLSCEH